MPKPTKKPAPPPAPKSRRPHRVTVELSDDELARLNGAVEREGISRSDVIRKGVREYPLPDAAGGIRRDS